MECLAEDTLRANLNEETDIVNEEVPCIVEKRVCVPSREEEESFGNENKVKRKSNDCVRPPSGGPGTWRCVDSKKLNWRNFSTG